MNTHNFNFKYFNLIELTLIENDIFKMLIIKQRILLFEHISSCSYSTRALLITTMYIIHK